MQLRLLAPVLLAACVAKAPAPATVPDGTTAEWPTYGGDAGGTRFSPLGQIDRTNVRSLRVAWVYHTGELPRASLAASPIAFEATPIVVGGSLFFSTPLNRVIALDPETGREKWTFDPQIDLSVHYGNKLVTRGVSAWRDANAAEGSACALRIFFGTSDARLIALDARTGARCRGFGDGGEIDLARGIRGAGPGEYQVTSPPTVIDDLVIVGSAITDNVRAEEPPGVVRAFDARTGAMRWSWDPLVHSGNALTGAANAWTTFAVDEARHLVFIPTGSASPDYFGGLRPGDDRDADSIVALDSRTGTAVWELQTVHHDVWDYDNAAPPLAFTMDRDGRSVDAVAQASKTGLLFLLDRATGAPLFTVNERPVPQGGVAGEALSATQPFPSAPPPLVPQRLEPKDAWGLTPLDRCSCRRRIARLRSEGIFTPASVEGSVLFPGPIGGVAWGGGAYDPMRRLLIFNTNRIATSVRLIPREQLATEPKPPGHVELSQQSGTPYAIRREFLLSPLRLPCNRPPWGALSAVDPATGAIRWEVPLGVIRLAFVGMERHYGTPNLGGPIATAGGLVFIAAAYDSYLRAFDVESGRELWRGRLPAGGQATPMTYKLRPGGRQFVVIAAGGHGRLGTKLGDALVAFALP